MEVLQTDYIDGRLVPTMGPFAKRPFALRRSALYLDGAYGFVLLSNDVTAWLVEYRDLLTQITCGEEE